MSPAATRFAQRSVPPMAMCFEFNSTNRIIRRRFWGQVGDEQPLDFYCWATLFTKSLGPLSGIADSSAVTPLAG